MPIVVLPVLLAACGGSVAPGSPEVPVSPAMSPLLEPSRSQLLVPRAQLNDSLVFSTDLIHHARNAQAPDGSWQVIVDGEIVARDLLGVFAGTPVLTPDGARAAWGARTADGWRVAPLAADAAPVDGLGKVGIRVSADGAHFAWQTHSAAGWTVVVDGVAGPTFTDLGPPTVASGTGAVIYAARDADGDHRVQGTERSALTAALEQVVFSSSGAHVVIASAADGGTMVQRDGETLGSWPRIGDVTVAPSGERWAYSRAEGERWTLVLDGEPASQHDRIGAPGAVFSPDGSHVAWWALDGGVHAVHRDGVAGMPWGLIGELPLTWSADGQHLAWLANEVGQTDDGTWKVVLDDQPVSERQVVAALAVDTTGSRVAWVAKDAGGWSVHVGRPGASVQSTPVYTAIGTDVGGGLVFDGDVLRYTAVDALGLHLHELDLGS